MAVLFRLSQNKVENSSVFGKWFAQAVMTGTIDTNGLAEIMQRNCTVKKSDILAVISELIETMQEQLQNSKRIKLNGFGTFKLGIENVKGGALTPADFSASKNIKGVHVLFQPEVKADSSGQRRKTFVTGCTVQQAPKNAVDTTKPAEPTNSQPANSQPTNGSTGSNGNGGSDEFDFEGGE